jgi:hypothetical protein
MKTTSGSNSRPLKHALFYTLILYIAALCAMPGTARAQIFETNYGGTVGEYTTSGATVNAALVSGLATPYGIAVSGGLLFVADYYNGTIGEYTTSGVTVNAALVSGLRQPYGIAVSGGLLFVVNNGGGGAIGEYTTSGATVNASLVAGMGQPYGIAVSGEDVFFTSTDGFGSNGAIYTFVYTQNPPVLVRLVGGLGTPYGIAVSGGYLFVVDSYSGTIGKYTTSGATVNAALVSGLKSPVGIAVSGGHLFVTNQTGGTIGEYDATSGAMINASLVSGLNYPRFIDVEAMPVPLANAGPSQTVQAGTLVTLDGSASSDPSGQLPLTYAWSFVSKPSGSAVTLSNPSIVNPTFTPDAVGNYLIQLIVTNTAGFPSTPATVTISTFDAPPVANAGPDQAITVIGTVVHLNGSQSYSPGGLPITYQWSFLSKPVGSNATLTGPSTATPSFVANLHGDYSIQLIVTDSLGTASSPATVTVTSNNVAPVANAGLSQSAVVGQTVTLNGSGSGDPDGDPLTYRWSLTSVPSGSQAVISNANAQIASFVPDLPGTFVAQIIVNDGFVDSLPATVQIQVISRQTQVTMNIQSLQQNVIANLAPSAFRNASMQKTLLNKLNAVIASIDAGNYADALGQLQNDILGKTDGCATSGAPDKNDGIVNCPDQSKVYTPLLNIIAEVKALCGC